MTTWDDEDDDVTPEVRALGWVCSIFVLTWLFWPWIKWVADHTGLS